MVKTNWQFGVAIYDFSSKKVPSFLLYVDFLFIAVHSVSFMFFFCKYLHKNGDILCFTVYFHPPICICLYAYLYICLHIGLIVSFCEYHSEIRRCKLKCAAIRSLKKAISWHCRFLEYRWAVRLVVFKNALSWCAVSFISSASRIYLRAKCSRWWSTSLKMRHLMYMRESSRTLEQRRNVTIMLTCQSSIAAVKISSKSDCSLRGSTETTSEYLWIASNICKETIGAFAVKNQRRHGVLSGSIYESFLNCWQGNVCGGS